MRYEVRELTVDREGHKEDVIWGSFDFIAEAQDEYNKMKKFHPMARIMIVKIDGKEESILRADYQESEVDLDRA